MKKKIYLLILATIMMSAVSFAQKNTSEKIPLAVKTEFQKKYPKAANIKWDKEDNNFEASFKIETISNSVLLNAKGEIIETEVEIKANQLPKLALNYIGEHYKNHKIKEAAKITNQKGELIYEAEIKGVDLLFDENGNFIKKRAQ